MSFIEYLRDTKAEMRHVSWPTQRQAIVFTALVVLFSVVVSLILGFSDFAFSRGLDWFISN